MTNLICAAILIIPWIIIPIFGIADPFRLPKETFFDLFCMALISYSMFTGIKMYYRNKYLSWFTAWIFITFVFSWFIPITNTMNGQRIINFWAISPLVHFILGLFTSFLCMSSLQEEDFLKIAKSICISSVLVSVVCILQFIGYEPFKMLLHSEVKNQESGYCTALLDNPNITGAFFALSLPFFLLFKKFKYVLGFILVLTGLILSNSTTSYIAIFIGLFLFLFLIYRQTKKLKFIIPFSFISIVVSFFVIFSPKKILSMLSLRDIAWSNGLEAIKTNPLFGQGLGIFKTLGYKINEKFLTHVHNDWIELVIQIGFIGLFLLLLVILNSFRKFNYDIKNRLGFAYLSSFVVFLVVMGGTFAVELAPLILIGMVNFWAIEKL